MVHRRKQPKGAEVSTLHPDIIEACVLRAQGHSLRAIAERLYVSQSTVRRWTNPAYEAAENERVRALRARQRAEGKP